MTTPFHLAVAEANSAAESAEAANESFALTLLPSDSTHPEMRHNRFRIRVCSEDEFDLDDREDASVWHLVLADAEGHGAWSRDADTLRASLASGEARLLLLTRNGQQNVAPEPPQRHRGGLAPGALRRVREYVSQRLGDRIDLAQLAEIAGLSACHFSRAFKQSMGVPPHRFVMRERVVAAARLVRSTNRSLLDISLELGFSDQSHFTRCFSEVIGDTPRAYRRQHR